MTNRLTILTVLSVATFLCVRTSAAQSLPYPDPDWGEHQNYQKAAEYWAWWERTGPDTNVAEARRQAAKEFTSMRRPMAMLTQAVTPAWTTVGGSIGGYASGRPTGMGFSKQHSSTCYLSTSGGGLYKSTNTGSKWVPVISPEFGTNAMGGVAVDPNDDNIVYVGTGDMYTGNDGELSHGDGMFKSIDGGLTWTQIATTGQIGSAVNQVLIDPVNTSIVYATGTDGVRKSIDAGATWKKLKTVGGGVIHMVIDVNNPNRLIAGGGGVIRLSTDYGETWSADLASNIGSKSTITMGISAKNSAIVFASVGSGATGNSVGVAKSIDSGLTWTIVNNPGGGYMSQQAFYDNACAVSPNTPNYVIVGGLNIFASANAGTSFPYSTDWTAQGGQNNYTHADIHVLTYGAGLLWALTDGGIFQSADNGKSWVSRNSSLSTLLFTGGDADKNFTFVLGGAQDNGICRTNVPSGTTFTETQGGDGGRVFVDQIDGLACYSTYISVSLQKSADGGISWDVGPNGDHNFVPANSALRNEGVPFYMYYDVCESDPAALAIAGGSNVYYSTDGCATLASISKSGTKPSSPVTVFVPAANSDVVYCGNSSTSYVTKSASVGSWAKSSTTGLGAIADWAGDPTDAGKVWVAIAGSGGHHFALSTDYGDTWQYPATNLPNVDCRAVARAPNGDLFLGHTLGVLRSIDGGTTWEPLTNGIPLAQVNKLRVRGGATKYLLASTYGHGMYSIDITNLPRTIDGVTTGPANSSGLAISSIVPNPTAPGGTTLLTYSAANPGWMNAKLFDETGREIRTVANSYAEAGTNSLSLLVPETAGSYYLALTQAGKTATRQIVVSASR